MEKVLNALKSVVRIIIRLVFETIHRLLINIFDTLLGFLKWPEKKLRLKLLILIDEAKNPIVCPDDLTAAIDYAIKSFKRNFNVALVPHGNRFAEVLQENVSPGILYTKGGTGALGEEFKSAGSFFAKHITGPIYPVTTFVVKDITGATGCSLGPISDYITLSIEGARNPSTLTHELAHACGLWHINKRSNLLWRFNNRGDQVYWWQQNILRSSRHITYW